MSASRGALRRWLRRATLVSLAVVAAVVGRLAVAERRQARRLRTTSAAWLTGRPAPTGTGSPTASPAHLAATGPAGAAVGPGTVAGERPDPEAGPAAVARWVPPVDGRCPPGYPVKVKLRSGLSHRPGAAAYARTVPDRCYPSLEAAAADGFSPAKR
jgi:hypothetical protein